MTRRNAAWLAAAGLVAAVLAAVYVITRRPPALAPTVQNPPGFGPEDFAGAASAPAAPVAATAPVAPVPPPLPATSGDLRVPTHTSPDATQQAEPVALLEAPLPTWVRLAIVGAALIAFFAVSLIATKGV